MKKVVVAWLLFFAVSGAVVAQEKYQRCGNGIIKMRMSISQVTKACGSLKPFSKTPYQKMYNVPNSGGEVKVYNYEKWEFRQYGKYRLYVNFFEGNVNAFWLDTSIRN